MKKITKLSIHFNCSTSQSSRRWLALLVITLAWTSVQAIPRTWDGKCIKNETITAQAFLESDSPVVINTKLYRAMVGRGSAIPSMINVKVDNRDSHVNDIYTHCPWAEPLPLTPIRYTDYASFRDVCYTIKVGKQQMENTIDFDTSAEHDSHELKELRMETLEEVVEQLREFNIGNCLSDMNALMFASYDQMLFTVNQFKYYDPSRQAKYNMQTPENMFLVREKQHGNVRDFIDGKLVLENFPAKQARDVIMFQMARAVNMVHLRGWIHKNLKNENFYVKKTVDNLLEVRLGEFVGAEMRQTHVVHDNTDDETYGGPFYIPTDAKEHPDDLGVDYYALGALLIEMLTDENVEEDYTLVKTKIETQKSIKLPEVFELNQAPVTKVEQIETEMELNMDDLLKGIDLTNINQSREVVQTNKLHEEQVLKQVETKFEIPDIANSFNSLDAQSLNLGFIELDTLKLDQNLDLRRDRILAGKYGNNEESFNLFAIDDNKNYGMMNHKLPTNESDKKIMDDAEELTDLQVHEVESLLNPTVTLESVNSIQLPDQIISIEQKSVSLVLEQKDVFVQEEKEVKSKINAGNGEYNYNGQNEAKILIKKMFSTNYFERFINLSIFGSDAKATGDPNFKAVINANQFQYSLCNMEVANYLQKTGQKGNVMLSTTECLMVFLARAILQAEASVVETYFHLLEPFPHKTHNMRSMDDVIKMILDDRALAAQFRNSEIDLETYLQGSRILI